MQEEPWDTVAKRDILAKERSLVVAAVDIQVEAAEHMAARVELGILVCNQIGVLQGKH